MNGFHSWGLIREKNIEKTFNNIQLICINTCIYIYITNYSNYTFICVSDWRYVHAPCMPQHAPSTTPSHCDWSIIVQYPRSCPPLLAPTCLLGPWFAAALQTQSRDVVWARNRWDICRCSCPSSPKPYLS